MFLEINPINLKSSSILAIEDKSAIKAQAPTIGTTSKPSFLAFSTKYPPGSDIKGVPASDTSATGFELFKYSKTSSVFLLSENL